MYIKQNQVYTSKIIFWVLNWSYIMLSRAFGAIIYWYSNDILGRHCCWLSAILIVYLEATIRLPLFTRNTISVVEMLISDRSENRVWQMGIDMAQSQGEQLLYIYINLGEMKKSLSKYLTYLIQHKWHIDKQKNIFWYIDMEDVNIK